MKTIIKMLLVSILALAIFCVAGCQPQEEPAHTHTLIHNNAKAPTCVNNGIMEHWYCPACNARFADEAATQEVTFADLETEELGHIGGTATCTEQAICERCSQPHGDLLAHTPNEDDGDCTSAVTCSACGATTTPAAKEHTGGTATCTEQAVCDTCGKAYGETLGHNFVEGTCDRESCGAADPNYVAPSKGGEADFDTIVTTHSSGGDSSYTKTYTTTTGWVITNSAIQAGGSTVMNPQFPVIGPDNTHKAVCLNGNTSAPGKVTSPTLTGGISKLNMVYTKMFTDTKLSVTITITDLTTGTAYSETISVELPNTEKYVEYPFEWVLDTPITGDFTIEIVNNCPSAATGNKDRFTILSLTWA